ncbi:MAG TPA: site-2 protease family protein [Gemmatimonadota bacterium]
MSFRRLDLPRGPFPPDSAPTRVATAPVDPVDEAVLSRLEAPRVYSVGSKRIVRGRLAGGPPERAALARELERLPVDAFFQSADGTTLVTVSRPRSRALHAGWPFNLVLFLLTLLTTTWGGAYWSGVDPFAGSTPSSLDWDAIGRGLAAGLPFSLSLLGILTCHEMGHWIAARRYGLDATLPFYIPVPPFLSPIGTLGAVIRMGTPLYDRRILMDVGAAGPIAGIAAALPILGYGILTAPLAPASSGPGLYLGEPLLFQALEALLRPGLGPEQDLIATSLVLAGWLGLFVTALNLIPIGQLDGGHVVHALFGRGQLVVGGLALVALAGMGWFWKGWWMWMAIMLLVVRLGHPPTLDTELPLDGRRKLVGWLTLLLLVLCFHPMPFELRL